VFQFSHSNLPPIFHDGAQRSYTDSFKYLGMVCDRHINLTSAADAVLRPFTAGTLRIKQFYGSMTLQTGYTYACGSLKHMQFLAV